MFPHRLGEWYQAARAWAPLIMPRAPRVWFITGVVTSCSHLSHTCTGACSLPATS